MSQMSQRCALLLTFLATCVVAEIPRALADMEISGESHPSLVDLRSFDFDQGVYELNTDWQIYWGQLLTPATLTDGKKPQTGTISTTYFDDLPLDDSIRYATFYKQLRLPQPAYHYSIYFPELRSASRIWINGRLVAENGRIGNESTAEIPEIEPHIVHLTTEQQTVDIVLQLSSYSNRVIGILQSAYIGRPDLVNDRRESARIRDAFAIGAILIMGFYHFALFFIRRNRYAPLWFGLFCLLLAIRSTIRSDGMLIYMMIDSPVHWAQFKIEHLGFSLGVAIFSHYVYTLYHREIPLLVSRIGIAGGLLYSTAVILFPLRIFAQILPFFQLFTVTLGVTVLAILIKAVTNKRNGSILFMIGFACIMAGTVNDILALNGAINSPTMSHISLFTFILFQAVILSKRFARAFTRVEEAETEIRQLNDSLERKVQDRTRTIRVILDNVKSGFMLVNRDLLIEEGFTRSCEDILAKPIATGQNFVELFDLSPRRQEHFELSISQVFDDLMPEEVTLKQIQGRMPVGDRVLSLQGSIVRSEQGNVQAILFTLTDSTELVHIEAQAKLNQTLLNIMQDKRSFKNFLADTFRQLQHAQTYLEQHQQDEVNAILHTLKGNFAAYGLDEIADVIHETEELSELQPTDLEQISHLMETFIERYQDILEIDAQTLDEKVYMLRDRNFRNLEERLQQTGAPTNTLSVCHDWIEDVKLVTFKDLMGPIQKVAQRLASKLGKRIDLHIEGEHLRVDANRYRLVFQNLIHLIRNSIDHGIEDAEDRGPKPATGQIRIAIDRNNEELRIMVFDDGQGLDIERIRDIAAERSLVPPGELEKMADEDVAHLIFKPGFSTRNQVTNISGRGVGMSALEQAVHNLDGDIQITSERGLGTKFTIVIPEHTNHQSRHLSA